MPRRPILVAFFLLSTCAASAKLQLQCNVRGTLQRVAAVREGRIYCGSGGRQILVPPNTKWVLLGELRRNAADALWSPTYEIARADLPDYELETARKPFVADVTLLNSRERYWQREGGLFAQYWPGGRAEGGIAVIAWVIDGKVVHVTTQPLPPALGGFFSIGRRFHLSADEARGQPVILVWSNGHFIPPVPRFSDPAQRSAFFAVEFDDAAALRRALAGGVKPDCADSDHVSLLQYAAAAGAGSVVDLLLSDGANPHSQSRHGTPLTWAVGRCRSRIVAKLLAAKADPNTGTADIGPLDLALHERDEDDAVSLINAGASPNGSGDTGLIPIVDAVNAGLSRVAAALLAQGAIFDFDRTLLARVMISQARSGHTGMVKLLLDHRVAPNHEAHNLTPLIAGAFSGDPRLARILLAHGAKPDQRTVSGMTALIVAAREGRTKYAQLLLEAGADPNARLTDGTTALLLSAYSNFSQIAKLLVKHGATLQTGGRSALATALSASAPDVAGVLADVGAKINLTRPDAATEIESAIIYDIAPLIQRAIADGWSPQTKFDGRWPALRLAQIYHADRCKNVLRLAGARLDASDLDVGNPREIDAPIKLLHPVNPVDPRSFGADFPSAVVEVEGIVDSDGLVHFPRMIRTTTSEVPRFAISAFRHWQFSPARIHGVAVPMLVKVPIVFPSERQMTYSGWELDKVPVPIKQMAPQYPFDMKRAGVTGAVVLEFTVKADGQVADIHVMASSASEFEDAAVYALQNWVFEPGEYAGRPVATVMQQPFSFTLRTD